MRNTDLEPDTAASAGPTCAIAPGIRRAVVARIKPTGYDDEGFPHTFARGAELTSYKPLQAVRMRREKHGEP